MDLLGRLLDTSRSLLALGIDAQGRVAEVNPALARAVGMAPAALVGLSLEALVHEGHRARVEAWLGGDEIPDERTDLVLRTAGGRPLPLSVLVEPGPDVLRLVGERAVLDPVRPTEELTRVNNQLATLARERARRERAIERLERRTRTTLEDLRSSYWHLRKIQEVLPFCMGCGQVKGEDDTWQSFVDYLRENEILVSHAYCPACADRYLEEQGLADEPSGALSGEAPDRVEGKEE